MQLLLGRSTEFKADNLWCNLKKFSKFVPLLIIFSTLFSGKIWLCATLRISVSSQKQTLTERQAVNFSHALPNEIALEGVSIKGCELRLQRPSWASIYAARCWTLRVPSRYSWKLYQPKKSNTSWTSVRVPWCGYDGCCQQCARGNSSSTTNASNGRIF